MVWKHIAALAALILISYPAAAFNDGPTQQTQGITFFVAIPLDARDVKEQSLYSGWRSRASARTRTSGSTRACSMTRARSTSSVPASK